MRTRLVLLALIILAFMYWRGTQAALKEQGQTCSYKLIYAYCSGKSQPVMPSIGEAIRRGMKF